MNTKQIGLTTIICLLVTAGIFAQGQWRPNAQNRRKDRINSVHSRLSHSFGLEGSLALLNFEQEQPREKQEILTVAFNALSEDPRTTFADLSEDKHFVQLCEENDMLVTGGPMLGNAGHDQVTVWVRTLRPASVQVRIINPDRTILTGPDNTTVESDLTAVIPVIGLSPETTYTYEVLVDGKVAVSNEHTVFTTLPEPDTRGTSSVVFGSCFHRWGLANSRQARQIRLRDPMGLIFIGDIAAQDRLNNLAMHRADYFLRDLQGPWKSLAASYPVYTAWDDHDYFDNDLWGTPEGYTDADKAAVCAVWRNCWNNPPYGNPDKDGGVFFRTRLGPADVILLDHRYFREKGNLLGDAQMVWLEKQLLTCEGPFIILSTGTMWSDQVSNGKDSWGVYDPESRERIFSFIEENNIGGVLLISGDRHGGRVFTIPRPSGYKFYEFEPATLGGRVGPQPTNIEWTDQIYGVSGEYAFGEFVFDTSVPDPTVTFNLVSESGTIFYQLTLTKSQLTPR